ncbi:MAG TPA: tetratricopeptide repeat protein [Reyranella sp.]|jgi:TPR repeat protein|nr:tetratricopeptide repeat protein [Reyranella sp.]
MTPARAALLAALLGICTPAFAQSPGHAAPPALQSAIATYRAGDLATAEAELRRLAAGNADAEAWLGAVLIDRDRGSEGLQALSQALAAGSPEAAHQLGLVYAQGLAGVARDDARAAQLFEKAAATGHYRAALNLGVLYFRGQGVPHDLVQARAWLEKAASSNDPYALYALGRAFEESQGAVVADPVRAADLYRRAAEQGLPLAALRYGLALADGLGVKADAAAAQKWLLAAQKDGVPEAALALGDMTARTLSPRDKAANRKILATAAAWYRQAADAGVPSAQFKLANAYAAGSGVGRDLGQATAWYGRAARQGLPEAQLALGVLLLGGAVGTADPVEGYKWLLLAERGGRTEAHMVQEKVSGQISPADRSRAEELAATFSPKAERSASDVPPRLSRPPR